MTEIPPKISKIEQKMLSRNSNTNQNNISMLREIRSEMMSSSIGILSQVEVYSSLNLRSLKMVDLSGVKDRSFCDSSLQELITSSSVGSTLVLPGHPIQLYSLDIQTSIIIKGSAGSKLILFNGPIQIQSLNSEKITVSLSELSIEFQVRQQVSNYSQSCSMIQVKPCSCRLEITDCYFTKISQIDEDLLQLANCITINKVDEIFSEPNSQSLIVRNCIIAGFNIGIKGASSYEVVLDNIQISSCKADGISLKQPESVIICKSVIEKCGCYGILIKIKGNTTIYTSPRSSIHHSARSMNSSSHSYVQISENTIKENEKSGIDISCNGYSRLHYNIEIQNNKVTNNKREGIALRHLRVNGLLVCDNTINGNDGSGIWLQKVSNQESAIFSINNNQLYDSHNGFGIYVYSTGTEIAENDIIRNYLGGIMIVGNYEKGGRSITLNKNTICNNWENGITVHDYIEGSLEIQHCIINENVRNGILLSVSRKSFHKIETFKSKITSISNLRGMAVVSFCEIQRNGGYGILTTLTYCLIQSSKILENKIADTLSTDQNNNNMMINELQSTENKKCNNCNPGKCLII